MKRLFWLLLLPLCLLPSCREQIDADWQKAFEQDSMKIRKIQFVTPDTAFAVGGIHFHRGAFFSSFDGGNTWRQEPKPVWDQTFFDLDFLNTQKGAIAAWGSNFFQTFDGGNTWFQPFFFRWTPAHALDFVNDTLIVAVTGEGYGKGFVYRWIDGVYWAVADSFPFAMRDVLFTDAGTGYACGYGAILKTTDSGRHWDYTPAKGEYFTAMSFPSPQTGYAVGRTGGILKTTDAGTSWVWVRRGNLPAAKQCRWNDVAFWDEQTGYVVGDKGLFWQTTDGGETWKVIDKFDQNDLLCITLTQKNEGFVGGDKGLIARFRVE